MSLTNVNKIETSEDIRAFKVICVKEKGFFSPYTHFEWVPNKCYTISKEDYQCFSEKRIDVGAFHCFKFAADAIEECKYLNNLRQNDNIVYKPFIVCIPNNSKYIYEGVTESASNAKQCQAYASSDMILLEMVD